MLRLSKLAARPIRRSGFVPTRAMRYYVVTGQWRRQNFENEPGNPIISLVQRNPAGCVTGRKSPILRYFVYHVKNQESWRNQTNECRGYFE
ncbi:hypothetical protein DL766_001265 [Monosporascus sp. MC13-8B]|uniref:Uncharacterized protein n=1 Tax=Monosporascus cannonballus TaxID=155416 RepID=A0ABY0H9W2_9PEZI|nr:hypothetical protein DL762_003676 [Monosporascus cannonballus]RYO96977.1 hypothetical protein DL763_003014 [Monosporascus cannonballus]RYP37968.1 hypothetical protein DL766_001265 [Monosporascus sp. MC13-8B]